MKIDLDDDQIDEIVLFEMQRHSKILESSISSLKRRRNLKKFEKEDLARYKEVLQAMFVISGYYGSHLT
jgi:hypothetical protein